MSVRRYFFILLVLGAADVAGARPGNPERYPVGARAMGRGGTGVAAETHPWYNPAGLGQVRDRAISASLNAYGVSQETSDELRLGPLTGRVESSSVDVFPASLSYAFPLGDVGGFSTGAGLSIVVPDWDRFDGTFRVPQQSGVTFELQARRFRETQTYWAVPAVGGCAGSVCLGLGTPVALHRLRNTTLVTTSAILTDGTFTASTLSELEDATALSGALSLGAQLALTERLRFGATVRTPTMGLGSSGNFLATDSFFTDIPGVASFANRIELDDPNAEYRQPWRLAAGIAYEAPLEFTLSFDLRFTAGMDDYLATSGPNGERVLQPTGVGGVPVAAPEQAIIVANEVVTEPVLNFNAGFEYFLSEKNLVQLGAFTDLSSTPTESVIASEDNKISRVGMTLGFGRLGEYADAWVSVTGTYGWGDTVSADASGELTTVGLNARSVLLSIGSSATL